MKTVKRAEKGEPIIIARSGRLVAQLGSRPQSGRAEFSQEDPLINLDIFAGAGPGGKISNTDIDRLLYGHT